MATVNSARSNYRDVASVPEAVTGRLLALANIEVHVLTPGGDPTVNAAHVNVFGSRNPADLAPLPQPIVTDATGIINFWAEPGEYDIFIHDRNAPARIADQRFGWSALSPVNKGIPAGLIRDDAALDLAALSAVIMRQIAPLGSVLDWWRPASTFDAGAGAGNPPPGYEVCDGRTLTAAQHDFGTGGSIVLPDLRHKVVVGADIAKADGAASDYTLDTTAGAPGIRGTGGSNRHTLTSGQSGTPGGPVALSIASDGSHAHNSSGDMPGWLFVSGGGGADHFELAAGTDTGVDDVRRAINTTTYNGTHAHAGSSASIAAAGAGAAHNNMPLHVGLLKIMKVRRA